MTLEDTVPVASAEHMLHGRVRVRTLVLIRWIAVVGQLVTLINVQFGFRFELPIGPALAVVAASALLNLWAGVRHPARARLSDRRASAYLGFDILQLSVLLFLVGGLQNPFALLILAPVTIAASILSRRSTITLCLLAILCVSVLALWHLPLPWAGEAFAIPQLYTFAVWLGLVLATILLAAYNWSVSDEARRMSDALSATQMALAREQRLSALGMLAAAAAHELGSPLGTIAVVAKEIARDLPEDSALNEDIALLSSESERCRQILAGLSQRPEEAGAAPYSRVPVTALVEAAAAPLAANRIAISFKDGPGEGAADTPAPMVAHSPEIIRGLGSLIQNAVQFARAKIVVATSWDDDAVTVEIRDDGRGFAPNILPFLGEPYLSSRKDEGEHMGLGIFIAQTLLERTGGVLSFANRPQGGAVVTVRWSREALEVGTSEERSAVP